MNRRGFLLGLLAAPVVIRTPGILMPIKSFIVPPPLKVVWRGWYADYADREELSNLIYSIDPMDTPIMTMASNPLAFKGT